MSVLFCVAAVFCDLFAVTSLHCLNILKRKSNLRTAKSSMANGNSNPKNTKITRKDCKRKQEETQRQGGLCRWWMGVRWAKREFVFLKFMIRHDKHKFSQEWFLWCTSYLYFYLYLYLCLYLYLYLYLYLCLCLCLYLYLYLNLYLYLYLYLSLYFYLYLYLYYMRVCVWCMHACMYVCGICCPHARFNYRNVSCIEGSVQDEIHGTMVLLSFCCLNTFLNHRDCWSSNILAMVGRWVSRVRPVEDENPKCHMVCGVCCFWSDALYHS